MSKYSCNKVSITRNDLCWVGHFDAMASPCEILLVTEARDDAIELVNMAAKEARRIEQKFSRYRDDSIIGEINRSNGEAIEVDPETASLLDYAHTCYTLSTGMFDITSGILRRAWRFDGSDQLPTRKQVKQLLKYVGLEKTDWSPPFYSLPKGMEIDFGGIGKEYAVDRTLQQLSQNLDIPILVNYGGDIAASKPPRDGLPWQLAIEKPGEKNVQQQRLSMLSGGLATSGDAWRFLLKKGRRYSHVLNPRTGWPVKRAARSVTVAADSCTQAGIISTIAMLQGENAETFLATQRLKHWVLR